MATVTHARPFEGGVPAGTLGGLALGVLQLVAAGLLAIAASGAVAGMLSMLFGTAFVAGDPPGVTYTAARCADFLRFHPDAVDCIAAAAAHHLDEVVWQRVDAGILGAVVLAAWWLARRAAAEARRALPPVVVLAAGAAAFGAAGASCCSSGSRPWCRARSTAGGRRSAPASSRRSWRSGTPWRSGARSPAPRASLPVGPSRSFRMPARRACAGRSSGG